MSCTPLYVLTDFIDDYFSRTLGYCKSFCTHLFSLRNSLIAFLFLYDVDILTVRYTNENDVSISCLDAHWIEPNYQKPINKMSHYAEFYNMYILYNDIN